MFDDEDGKNGKYNQIVRDSSCREYVSKDIKYKMKG